MDCHVFTGSYDKNFVCIAFSHRHGETATDDVSENVVEDNVRFIGLVGSCFF